MLSSNHVCPGSEDVLVERFGAWKAAKRFVVVDLVSWQLTPQRCAVISARSLWWYLRCALLLVPLLPGRLQILRAALLAVLARLRKRLRPGR